MSYTIEEMERWSNDPRTKALVQSRQKERERIAALEAELARLRTDLKFANIEANHQKETVVSLHASLKQAERELAEGRARLMLMRRRHRRGAGQKSTGE